ncbi:MAG: 7-cyano-7-deazaguanine synthase [Cetobacterium sp.]|uniref:7-cyano-7-deazaguanine synthase n=1 Tax=unclassified Cetobacterium TaxID=2630983 RepID=UPI000645E6D8|nr:MULTISPECIES: 7-cyano-7-deazaguanine synthase [unclassified Cetobacterium]
MKALALFSGGLDSALAIKIIKDQGIEVIALNFVSHFFGGKNEKAENMAKQLGVQLEYVNFTSAHTEILKNPVHGRGKNMNPCIDCHALMFKTAGDLMEKFGASFIISGEVLGQRPMSQNYQALEKVKAMSPGLENLIVRPLSAKLLPESEPEKLGWVDREKLLDIQGRSRKTQMELMDKFGIVDYPTPGGGCLLTDPGYSKRLRILEEDGLLEDEHSNLFHLLKIGRFFRFEKGKYLIVGREQDDNIKINEFKSYGSLFIRGKEVPGPHMVGFGDLSKEQIDFALNLFSRYSKVKGNAELTLLINGEDVTIPAVNLEALSEEIAKYQITM